MALIIFPRLSLIKPEGVGLLVDPRHKATLALLLNEPGSAVLDHSPYRRALTWNGTLTRGAGKRGRMVTFDGSTGYLRFASNITGELLTYTFIALFRTTATTKGRFWFEHLTGGYYRLFTMMENGAGNAGELALGMNTDGLNGWVESAAGVLNGIINDGNWHVAIGTSRGSADREIFLDGKSYATNTTAITTTRIFTHGDVGRQEDGAAAGYFNGDLATFAILERGVSAAEAKVLSAELFDYLLVRQKRPATGVVLVSGTVAATNANDTGAAVGVVKVTGTAAATNANDAAAAVGVVKVTGTVSATNANDTCAANGTVTVTGTVAATNANDTSSARGLFAIGGHYYYKKKRVLFNDKVYYLTKKEELQFIAQLLSELEEKKEVLQKPKPRKPKKVVDVTGIPDLSEQLAGINATIADLAVRRALINEIEAKPFPKPSYNEDDDLIIILSLAA